MPNGGATEGNVTQEPMVLADPTGLHQLRMWYTANWGNESIAMAYSDDLGLTWTRDNGGAPIIGHGSGGVSTDAAHTGLWSDPANPLHLDLFYTNPDSATTTMNKVSSTDGGLTWGNPVVILSPAGWETGRWGNAACIKNGSTWHLLYESMDSTGVWQMGYATSTNGTTYTRQNGGNPVTGLRVGTGTFGGPDLHLQADGTWELFYHASASGNLPTDIYRAVSTDLINWSRRPGAPIVSRTLSFEVDQCADPSVVDIGGQRYMWYSCMDNVTPAGKVNRAVYVPPA